jgi:hypothetical protein
MYVHAHKSNVDVWEMKLLVDEEKGEIIPGAIEKNPKVDEKGNRITVFKKTFINYLSIGYDARVGFGFEKGRCGNRCCNKLLYFWEGCKKNCCRSTIKLNSLIDRFQTINIKEEINHEDQNETMIENKAKAQVLFKSRQSMESEITTNTEKNPST